MSDQKADSTRVECPHTGEVGHTMTFRSMLNGITRVYECNGCGQWFKEHHVAAHRLREEIKRLRWFLDRASAEQPLPDSPCPTCGGEGVRWPQGTANRPSECPDCDGTGCEVDDSGVCDSCCLTCGGSGNAPTVTDEQVQAAWKSLATFSDGYAQQVMLSRQDVREALEAVARIRQENDDE